MLTGGRHQGPLPTVSSMSRSALFASRFTLKGDPILGFVSASKSDCFIQWTVSAANLLMKLSINLGLTGRQERCLHLASQARFEEDVPGSGVVEGLKLMIDDSKRFYLDISGPFAAQIDKGLLLRALQIMRWLTIRRAEISVFQHLQDRAQKMATLSVEKMERLVLCFLLTLTFIKNGIDQTKPFHEV
jgi:hypothetical protein